MRSQGWGLYSVRLGDLRRRDTRSFFLSFSHSLSLYENIEKSTIYKPITSPETNPAGIFTLNFQLPKL
jgi:hypothetical protein